MGQPEDTRSARNATAKRSEGFLELAKIGSGTFFLANPFLAHRKRRCRVSLKLHASDRSLNCETACGHDTALAWLAPQKCDRTRARSTRVRCQVPPREQMDGDVLFLFFPPTLPWFELRHVSRPSFSVDRLDRLVDMPAACLEGGMPPSQLEYF